MHPFRLQLITSRAYPALLLDGLIGHRERHFLLRLFRWLIFLLVIILAMASLSPIIPFFSSWLPLLQTLMPKVVGGLFLIFSIWLTVYLLEAYFRSHYFSNFTPATDDLFTFDIGRMLYRAS